MNFKKILSHIKADKYKILQFSQLEFVELSDDEIVSFLQQGAKLSCKTDNYIELRVYSGEKTKLKSKLLALIPSLPVIIIGMNWGNFLHHSDSPIFNYSRRNYGRKIGTFLHVLKKSSP